MTIRMRHSRELTKTRTLSPQKIFYLLCVVSNWKVLHLVSLVHKMFHRLFHASCMWLCTCFQLLLVLKMPRNQTMHFLSVWVPLRYACLQLCHGYACLQLCLPAGSRSRGLSPTCFCGLGGGGRGGCFFTGVPVLVQVLLKVRSCSRNVRFFTNNQYKVIFEPNNKSYFFTYINM